MTPTTPSLVAPAPEPHLNVRPAAGVWRRVRTASDDPLVAVLVIWLATTAILFAWIQQVSLALPHADEYYAFVPLATGQEPLTWTWLWAPANEHRAPLLRLALYGLGEAFDWNFRVLLRVNLAVLAGGVLALVLAVRWVRGRSAVTDAVIPLAVLNPAGFETIVLYSYAYTAVSGLLWLALALAASGAVYRWRAAWYVYAAIAPALALSGGPPGQVWALGLVGAAPFVWATRSFGWVRHTAAVWAVAVVGLVGFLVWATPPAPANHEALRAASLSEAGWLSLKYATVWLGAVTVQATWPYVGLALLPPLALIVVGVVRNLYRAARERSAAAGGLPRWLPASGVFGATVALALVMAYTRSSHHLWASRYHLLLVPLGVAGYLLLVQFRSSQTVLRLLLAVVLASWGYNWVIRSVAPTLQPAPRQDLVHKLRDGDHPLSLLAIREAAQCGVWPPVGMGPAGRVIGCWDDLRRDRLGVFRRSPEYARSTAVWPPTAALSPGLEVIADEEAVRLRAVRPIPGTTAAPGRLTCTYRVPATQNCQVWLRYQTAPGGTGQVKFKIDDGPEELAFLPPSATYAPGAVAGLRPMTAGQHRLEVIFVDPAMTIDFIEVIRDPIQ